MYGVTYSGGVNNYGVLFKFNTQKNTFTKKKDFDGSAGRKPFGGLVITSTGLLYGMAYEGGVSLRGTIYAYDTATNVLTKKIDFAGTSNGAQPLGRLIQATNGLLYGMTLAGGNIDRGVLFEYNPTNGVLTKKIDFEGDKGLAPYGSLFQAANGKLYGTTEQGIAGFGGLFEYNISSGNLSTVVSFDGSVFGKGGASRTTLMQASDGKLYGMNSLGGMSTRGVLFSYDPTNSGYHVKVNFEYDSGNGMWPYASLVQGANGRIYGTTYTGGTDRGGILFEYDITNAIYTKKLDFTPGTGVNPASNMTLGSNGKLYGVTRFGGAQNAGVIFEYDPAVNSYTKKIDFQASSGNPVGGLIQIPNGKMYGVANIPGSQVQAMLFEYDPSANTFVIKFDFDGAIDGNTPSGRLLYSNGKIYGLMRLGGVNNMGTLFQFDPTTGVFLKLKDFNGTNHGAQPVGSLIKAKNDKLYGVTQMGGLFNAGTIFEYDQLTEDINKKFDFSDPMAGLLDVQSGLVESSNGKLYGTTLQGGSQNYGGLYEFDIESNTYTKKLDFTGINGAYVHEALLFVSMEEQTITFGSLQEKKYGDTPFALNATTSSGLSITYSSSNPAVASVNGNTVTIHTSGTTTITASQGGSPNFHSASVSQVLTVNKADQTIAFGPIAEKTTVDDPLNLSASASSGLPITYLSSNPAVATISGNVLTINGDGTALITATQPGNVNYNSASNVMQTLVVLFVLAAENPFTPPMKLYPNPADREFIIEAVGASPLNASNLLVYDYLGRASTIPLEKLEDGKYRCTITQLAPGLHFVVIPGRSEPKPIVIVR